MKCVVIGTAPLNEVIAFAELGDEVRAKKAAEVFARQVVRHAGPPPLGVRITVDRVPDPDRQRHVYCAVCYYDEANEQAVDYAFRCEDEAPLQWDDVARAELVDEQ